MKYDVFISYSRRDIDTANRLCTALEKAGISYWIDRNIHGSENFLSEITQCIRNCKVVVFIASANSSVSLWSQKEVIYALKLKKVIVPYRIGSFSFANNNELDLVFTNVQWVESEQSLVDSLVALGCSGYLNPTYNPSPTPKRRNRWWYWSLLLLTIAVVGTFCYIMFDNDAQSQHTYSVGDYYKDNGKEGVVFVVWDGGRHGKIISLDQTETAWDSRVIYDFDKCKWIEGTGTRTHTDSKNDGKPNTDKILARSDCQYFDAFEWCRAKGEDWYLSAKDELIQIYNNIDVLNSTLNKYNGCSIYDSVYWSSTESVDYEPEFCAWGIYMSNGSTYSYSKYRNYYVRAISAF